MTISDILEHWATIYKPLSHDPSSDKLEDQRFFRIRYIDLENIFSRNSNVLHSPLMLQSVTMTGNLRSEKKSEVSHQVWLLAKIKDTAQTLGRFDGLSLESTANELLEHAEQLVSYLMELRRTQICPITKQSFKGDPQLAMELSAIDVDSVSYGVLPDIFQSSWLVLGVDWHSLKPLYNFSCGANGKYILPDEDSQSSANP